MIMNSFRNGTEVVITEYFDDWYGRKAKIVTQQGEIRKMFPKDELEFWDYEVEITTSEGDVIYKTYYKDELALANKEDDYPRYRESNEVNTRRDNSSIIKTALIVGGVVAYKLLSKYTK